MKLSQQFDIDYIEQYFSQYERDFDKYYVRFHKYRYQILLNLIDAIRAKESLQKINILDVGPMFQTNIMRDSFDGAQVNSLGYHWKRNKIQPHENHIEVNLNETDEIQTSDYHRVNIVTCAEVIEHLYTMPSKVIGFLSEFLVDSGYMILQTPNGVSLDRRVNMLMGKNPYDMINEKRQNHYREYTLKELSQILQECGYKIHHTSITNYFNPEKTWGQRMFRKLSPIIPRNLRQGMTIVAQKK